MAKSIEVLSCTRAFHSVPSQLISRIVAGNPREEARSEKTRGEKGFMPLENMCWPQTQKPNKPTPHSARTTRRSFQTGRRENVESVEAMRKRGLKIHTLTPELDAEWDQTVAKSYPKVRGMAVPPVVT